MIVTRSPTEARQPPAESFVTFEERRPTGHTATCGIGMTPTDPDVTITAYVNRGI
jgi:hypothetical protein